MCSPAVAANGGGSVTAPTAEMCFVRGVAAPPDSWSKGIPIKAYPGHAGHLPRQEMNLPQLPLRPQKHGREQHEAEVAEDRSETALGADLQ